MVFVGKIRIMVLESHAAMRDGLVSLISGAADTELVGAAASEMEALCQLPRSKPDVLVVDTDTTHAEGFVREVAATWHELPVIALVDYEWDDVAKKVISAGAAAFVAKDQIAGQLLPLVREIVGRARDHKVGV